MRDLEERERYGRKGAPEYTPIHPLPLRYTFFFFKSLQASALQRPSFQETLSPKPSSTFPTSFPFQQTKVTTRKQVQPLAAGRTYTHCTHLRPPPRGSPPWLPDEPPHLQATPLTGCPISDLSCPGAPSLRLSGLRVRAGSPGAPAHGLGPETPPGPPSR